MGTANSRRLALDVHAQLRQMILTGELRPGSSVPQAPLARKLGVSRTPMREAFRLLQEEGLIEYEPDQRARVKPFDAEDLDSLYGARVLLESLGVSLSVGVIDQSRIERMADAVERMERHAKRDELREWHVAHREFHQISTSASGSHLRRELASLAEHSERYILLGQLSSASSYVLGEADHRALLQAFRTRDRPQAVQVIARHLTRTALTVLAEMAPEYEPVTTRAALRMATNYPQV
jgi:DNA-binding GntR family transcriptional regulator